MYNLYIKIATQLEILDSQFLKRVYLGKLPNCRLPHETRKQYSFKKKDCQSLYDFAQTICAYSYSKYYI